MVKMQPHLIFISLAALLGSSMAFSFSPIKIKTLPFTSSASKSASASASPSALSLSDNTNALPFFAAPAFSGQQGSGAVPASQSGASTSSPPQSATVTLRLPLGTLFDGRDYIFVTESNVRGYEWTTKESDILLDDLMDAALGNLGSKHDHPGTAVASEDDTSSSSSSSSSSSIPPPALITDYELSQIVLVPTSDWDSNLFGLGNRYDVYDGQQRLVTLNLLLAGLRDAFQSEANELNNNQDGSVGKRAVALAATAMEISGMLMPTKVRKEDVLRINLRKRDNVLLEQILLGGAIGEDGSSGKKQMISPQTYSKLSPKGKSDLLSSLSPANTRIFQNFVHLSQRLALLTTRERLRLLDYIVERVYLLVCIPETSRIARNIVMSQGRKGMDNEPVDDFKGLVCFRYTLEEEDMYQLFDRWDALAAEPSAVSAAAVATNSLSGSDSDETAGGGSSIKSVGRDIISATCLLRASASLRTKIRSRGGDEVYEWERWLRNELWVQNNQQQQNDEQQPWQGKDFFVKEIEPASIALYKFRTGQWDEFAFLSNKSRKLTKKQRDTIIARLNFLREITAGVPSSKEAEIVILELLMRAEDDEISNSMLGRYLDEILTLIEKWTLWMALVRPSPMQRHSRVFALLDAMDDLDSVGSKTVDDDQELASALKESMDEYQFGATPGGKRLAAAILKRINTHLLLDAKRIIPANAEDATVETLIQQQQQQWASEEEREEWLNKIGNMVLVSSTSSSSRGSRSKKKSDASSWESKCIEYKKEAWPTTKQLAELDHQWDINTVKDQQKDIVSMMETVWGLKN